MKETKMMASRIRIDLTSVLDFLCLHPPEVPEKNLCPKLLRAKKYSAVLSVRWMDFSPLAKQYFCFRALQLVELQPP